MGASLLIVEDDAAIAGIIALYAAKDGHRTRQAGSAEEALTLLGKEGADLVILDLNLPGMDGFEFLRRLRKQSEVPLIIVSAREEDEDKILGLGLGADDFMAKPFSPRVLAARIRALLRRTTVQTEETPAAGQIGQVHFGPFVLHPRECYLEMDGRRLSLSPKEFEVLCYLVAQSPGTCKPEDIFRAVWGNDYGDVSTVAVHLRRLRTKLEVDPGNPRWLVTEHGFGYRFDPLGGRS